MLSPLRTEQYLLYHCCFTGVAVNAICNSGTGFLSYIARDPRARSITSGISNIFRAAWWQVGITGLIAALCFIPAFRYSKQLNSLLLGDDEANYIGTDTDKLKRRIMLLNTAMVAVATSLLAIDFVGLIVPHILRLLIGSDNRKLLPASMFAGAILLTLQIRLPDHHRTGPNYQLALLHQLGAPVFIVLLEKVQSALIRKEEAMVKVENVSYSIGNKKISIRLILFSAGRV